MNSRTLLAAALLPLVAGLSEAQNKRPAFTVVEATIPEIQAALASKRTTSRELVTQYLVRIAMYDRVLHSLVTVNPKALAEADACDRERAAGKVRGPLHGIPIALKDNIHTTDMPTTGGALAFAELIPPYEATLTRNLRDAGAIIIAKTTLIELANWVAGAPTPMAAYNAVSGFGFNPYDPRRDPRETSDGRAVLSPGGSSSGAGTAANLWAANVGSDTGGSIVQPSNQAMLVGMRPTIGRISRYGVIPITADHDTAGPMTRSVTDAAILLGTLESAAPDANDPATRTCTPPPNRNYVPFLKRDSLKGARIGIPRAFYYEPVTLPGEQRTRGGLNAEQQKVMARAIEVLKQEGAVIVDPVVMPSFVDPDPKKNFLLWPYCSGADQAKGKDETCSVNFKYGMKRDFNQWLASLGPAAPVKTLTELREWNLAHAKAGAIKYGQSRLDISDEMDLAADHARNEADVKKDQLLSRTNGIDAVLQANHLDAILTPASSASDLSARAGYPLIVVPFAMVANAGGPQRQNAFPAGFNARPAPYGVGFTGGACSEPRLIGLAYAFEQATRGRVPPALFPRGTERQERLAGGRHGVRRQDVNGVLRYGPGVATIVGSAAPRYAPVTGDTSCDCFDGLRPRSSS
jgi:amidase